MRLAIALVTLLCACGTPRLQDVVTDAGFTCPDGALCATAPDGGGCDPLNWQTSCGPGLVCASDGTCGAECGDGNTVCDLLTACDFEANCIPECLDSSGKAIVAHALKPGQTCLGRGYDEPAQVGLSCIIPCFYALCDDLYNGSCDPSVMLAMSRVGGLKGNVADMILDKETNPFRHHLTAAATEQERRRLGLSQLR